MVRTFVCLGVLGVCVFSTCVLGAHLLDRRWNREGFYE